MLFISIARFRPLLLSRATTEQRSAIAELSEELDGTRKVALAEVPGLTMTELYNLRALNHERAAEEAAGHVRWLRPEYQIPRFAPAKS